MKACDAGWQMQRLSPSFDAFVDLPDSLLGSTFGNNPALMLANQVAGAGKGAVTCGELGAELH